VRQGTFSIQPKTQIPSGRASRTPASTWRSAGTGTGYKLKVVAARPRGAPRGTISSHHGRSQGILGPEGYELSVAPDSVVIFAPPASGHVLTRPVSAATACAQVFASQPFAGQAWRIPCVQIEDQPRFRWRGPAVRRGPRFLHRDPRSNKVLDALPCTNQQTPDAPDGRPGLAS